jgi:hypothetical protein
MVEGHIQEIYKVLDEMLTSTIERSVVPAGELQNWMLDMRSSVKRLEEELVPATVG